MLTKPTTGVGTIILDLESNGLLNNASRIHCIALFLVSHLRRSTNDSRNHEEGGRINLSQLRGSHSIAQISDNLIGLERDQQSEGGRGLTTVRVLKNRLFGETGTCGTLDYNLNTCRFTEDETTEPPVFNPATDF